MASEDKVRHNIHGPTPTRPTWEYETVVEDDGGNTYTGTGWDREDADRSAGEKRERGDKD